MLFKFYLFQNYLSINFYSKDQAMPISSGFGGFTTTTRKINQVLIIEILYFNSY